MDDIGNRAFDLFHIQGIGDIGCLDDLCRHVPRRGLGTERLLDLGLQLFCQLVPLGEFHEQDDALIPFPVLSDGQAVGDLFHLLHLVVKLGGADANTGGLEHGVGAAIEGEAAGLAVVYHIVSMTPYIGVHREVGILVLGIAGIVPEVKGHGWCRSLADQLPFLIGNGTARFVINIDLHGQRGKLELTGIHGTGRASRAKAAVDVGTAGRGVEPEVFLDFLVHILESLGREGRAGLPDLGEVGQIEVSSRFEALILDKVDIAGTGAEHGYLLILHQLPHGSGIGVARVAVVEDQRVADCQ